MEHEDSESEPEVDVEDYDELLGQVEPEEIAFVPEGVTAYAQETENESESEPDEVDTEKPVEVEDEESSPVKKKRREEVKQQKIGKHFYETANVKNKNKNKI